MSSALWCAWAECQRKVRGKAARSTVDFLFHFFSLVCWLSGSQGAARHQLKSKRTGQLLCSVQIDARQPSGAQDVLWKFLLLVALQHEGEVNHDVPAAERNGVSHYIGNPARRRAWCQRRHTHLAYFFNNPTSADAMLELPTSHVTSRYRSVTCQSCCSFLPRIAGLVPIARLTIHAPSAMRGMTWGESTVVRAHTRSQRDDDEVQANAAKPTAAHLPATVAELVVSSQEPPPQQVPRRRLPLNAVDRHGKVQGQMYDRVAGTLRAQCSITVRCARRSRQQGGTPVATCTGSAQDGEAPHDALTWEYGRVAWHMASVCAHLERDRDEEARVAPRNRLLHIPVRVCRHASDLVTRLEQIHVYEISQ